MNRELLELANAVTVALGPKVADPIVLTRVLEAGAVILQAAEADDEARRGLIQTEVLRLQNEFGGAALSE